MGLKLSLLGIWRTRNIEFAVSRPASFGLCPNCTSCTPCYGTHTQNPQLQYPRGLAVEGWIKQISINSYIFQNVLDLVNISFRFLSNTWHIKPSGQTCAGGFLHQFSVACALDQSAIGAGSIQQGVRSHSNVFHQIKLGRVCPPNCPDGLSIQKHNTIIQITVYSSHVSEFTSTFTINRAACRQFIVF